MPKPEKEFRKKIKSQLNSVHKCFCKILNLNLSNKTQQTIRSIAVQPNVVYPRNEGWYNIQKSIAIIHHVISNKCIIILIDTEKVFAKKFHFNPPKKGIVGIFLNLQNLINTILNGRESTDFPLKSTASKNVHVITNHFFVGDSS